MGEFIRDTKLGTCESLYYTSYEQLKATSKFTESEKASFLKLDSGYRFRFPFTDENVPIGTHQEFDRYMLLEVPLSIGVEISHDEIFIRSGFKNKPTKHWQEFGVTVKCCQDPDNKGVRRWHNQNTLFLGLYQQKYTTQQEGRPMLVTCAICPYCGSISQLSFEELTEIAKYYECLEQTNEIKLILDNVHLAIQGYVLPIN
jgi:hypothetical protein